MPHWGNWISPWLHVTDKAWLNINHTLLETGLGVLGCGYYNRTMFLPASSGLIAHSPDACQVLETGQSDKNTVLLLLLWPQWDRQLISLDWGMSHVLNVTWLFFVQMTILSTGCNGTRWKPSLLRLPFMVWERSHVLLMSIHGDL